MASRGVGLFGVLVAGLMVGFVHPRLDAQTAPTPEERVAALKKSLADSQAQLRRYQWIETTVISLKGEDKSRKQQTVYYGADGTLTKLPIGGAAPPPQAAGGGGGGRRGARVKGAIVENTYLNENKDEVVALDVRFGSLTDGTSYTAETTLDAKAKNIRVVIQNTGHKPLAK